MQPFPRRELCHRIQVGSPPSPPRGASDGDLPPLEVQGLAALAVVVAFAPLLPVGYFPESLNHASGTVGRLSHGFCESRWCTPLCVAAELPWAVLPPSPRPLANFTISPSLPQSRSLGRETPPPNKEVRCGRCGNGGNGADGEDLRPLLLQSVVGEALALARSPPSNLPSVNMARSCLSLPEFLKQSGSRYVCSSTAGKGVNQGGQPWVNLTPPPRCKGAVLLADLSLSLSILGLVY